jgi:acyl CoA:acetate/3-ketoacid CoA transferase beta subunit
MGALTKEQISARIAKNVAAFIDSSAKTIFVLNLGVGIPTQVADYITTCNPGKTYRGNSIKH